MHNKIVELLVICTQVYFKQKITDFLLNSDKIK